MALPGVLSALRELILDEGALPASAEERLSYYRTRFPALTEPEREDLAKMRPDRLAIYTTSIFAGERNLLVNKFPISFELLAAAWEKVHGEPFDGTAFVRDLHAARPWRDNQTSGIVANFVEFMRVENSEIVERVPLLSDTLRIEHRSFELARADGPLSAGSSTSPADLASLAIGELLQKPARLPAATAFEEFAHDVVELYVEFHTGGRTLPKHLPLPRTTFAVGARNARGFVRWVELPEAAVRQLQALRREEQLAMGELAEALTAGEDSSDEARLFNVFFSRLRRLMESGAVIVEG